MTGAGALLAGLLAASAALAAPGPAELKRFEVVLEGHDSATAALQLWCDERHLAPGAKIVARRIQGADRPPSAEARRALGLKPGVAVRYRRVALACGDKVLSEADNWYLPGRLTADMNRRLDQTEAPFGAVVAPLAFHRRTLTTRVLLGHTPHAVLRHSAVLTTPDGAPFSFVVETYTDQALSGG